MGKVSNSTAHLMTTIGMFIALGVLIVFIMPNHTIHFQYNFELGKPWGYDLLTADTDFPIYKTEEQLLHDKQEALMDYAPYFTYSLTEQQHALEAIEKSHLHSFIKKRLSEQITTIYSSGIISLADYQNLQKNEFQAIMLMQDGVAKKVLVTSLYTPKTAYVKIVSILSDSLVSSGSAFDITSLLHPNILFDAQTSQKVHQSILDGVSTTHGLVQSGERIIDRGEVVSEKTYQILDSMKRLCESQEADQKQVFMATAADALLVLLYLALLYSYLFFYRRSVINSNHHTGFMCLMIGGMVGLMALLVKYTTLSVYLIPIVWVPILSRIFYDSRTATLIHVVVVMLMSFYAPNVEEFICMQLVVGVIAVFSLRDLTRRAQLFQTALYVLLAYAVLYTAITLSVNGDISSIDPWQYLYFLLNALLVILAYGLIYLFEKPFHLVSSITLVELTNVNNPLLEKLADCAPGTFQHSLQVSNLATAAAERIGANSLLVRTGALYHDVGKILHPELFTENQQQMQNPLNDMTPQDASQHIIAHVTDGVVLAQKYHLPDVIVSFIQTHHGKGRVRYFYNVYYNAHKGEIIDESLFTYPGPHPTTREATILMMADAIEARSRSLAMYNEHSIRQMVNEMIADQIADGLFECSLLSFRDVEVIKATFVEKLLSINHHRISYPTLQK